MPTYDYVCGACGHALEIFHSISEAPKKKCPACGKPRLERQIGAGAGILFKGGGFYQTDYRSDSYKAAQKADSDAGPTATPATGAQAETPKQERAGDGPASAKKTEAAPTKGVSGPGAGSKPKKSKSD